MQTDKMIVAVEDESGPVCECTLDEFLAGNECFSDEDKADLAALTIGAKLKFGGGAAPVFTVERVS